MILCNDCRLRRISSLGGGGGEAPRPELKLPTYEEAMEAKRKEEVVTSSSSQREESTHDLSWKAASRLGQQEGAQEEGPQSTAQNQGLDHIQAAADQGDNPTTSAGDAEVPPPYASSASSQPSSPDGVAVPSTTN